MKSFSNFLDFLREEKQILLFAGLFIIGAVYSILRPGNGWLDWRKNDKCFRKLSRALGLPLTKESVRGMPSIEGKYDGFYVNIVTIQHNGNEQYFYNTHIEIKLSNPHNIEFTLGKEGVLHKIGKNIGIRDIETGIPDFDELFLLQGEKEDGIRKIFDNEICNLLVENADMLLAEIKLNEHTIWYREKGLITTDYSVERMLTIHKIFLLIAEKVQGKSPGKKR